MKENSGRSAEGLDGVSEGCEVMASQGVMLLLSGGPPLVLSTGAALFPCSSRPPCTEVVCEPLHRAEAVPLCTAREAVTSQPSDTMCALLAACTCGKPQILSAHFFRVTRNADVERNEEEAEDLLEMITDEVRHFRPRTPSHPTRPTFNSSPNFTHQS